MRNRLVDDTYKRCDHKFHGWSWNLKKHINAQQNSSFDERHSMKFYFLLKNYETAIMKF